MKLVHVTEGKNPKDVDRDELAYMFASKHKFATYAAAEDYWWNRQMAAEQEMMLINHKIERLVQQKKLTQWTSAKSAATKEFVGGFSFRTNIGHVYVPKEQASSPLATFVRQQYRKYEHLNKIINWMNTDLLDIRERLGNKRKR